MSDRSQPSNGHQPRRTPRAAKAGRARELRAEDPTLTSAAIAQQIARQFGEPCTASTVRDYLTDPDASRAATRKARYRGRCTNCGAPVSGSGPQAPRTLCRACANRAAWTRHTPQSIVDTLRAWHREQGRWPTSTDLSRTHARRRGPHAEALLDRYGLSARAVSEQFGTFAAALDAARAEEHPGGAGDPHA